MGLGAGRTWTSGGAHLQTEGLERWAWVQAGPGPVAVRTYKQKGWRDGPGCRQDLDQWRCAPTNRRAGEMGLGAGRTWTSGGAHLQTEGLERWAWVQAGPGPVAVRTYKQKGSRDGPGCRQDLDQWRCAPTNRRAREMGLGAGRTWTSGGALVQLFVKSIPESPQWPRGH